MDEACAVSRVELDSVPAALDSAVRWQLQLEIGERIYAWRFTIASQADVFAWFQRQQH
eukprot:SAG31_NODE_44901_length_261_cov_0.574074_2_plen_58_part_01